MFYSNVCVVCVQSRGNQMKKLVPDIILKKYKNPRLIALQIYIGLCEKLKISVELFSPTEELFKFIQDLGYLLYSNMSSTRCVHTFRFPSICHNHL